MRSRSMLCFFLLVVFVAFVGCATGPRETKKTPEWISWAGHVKNGKIVAVGSGRGRPEALFDAMAELGMAKQTSVQTSKGETEECCLVRVGEMKLLSFKSVESVEGKDENSALNEIGAIYETPPQRLEYYKLEKEVLSFNEESPPFDLVVNLSLHNFRLDDFVEYLQSKGVEVETFSEDDSGDIFYFVKLEAAEEVLATLPLEPRPEMKRMEDFLEILKRAPVN